MFLDIKTSQRKLYIYIKCIVSYLPDKMNKSMTRKLSLIFTFSMILAYFILVGLLGQEGFLHATAKRGGLEDLRQRQEVLLLQVDSLEQQKELMSSQDALKDAAFRFGYQMEGEQVFYFTDEGEDDHTQQGEDPISKMNTLTFSGFSKSWIALMALVFSSLFTIIWGKWVQRRDRHR